MFDRVTLTKVTREADILLSAPSRMLDSRGDISPSARQGVSAGIDHLRVFPRRESSIFPSPQEKLVGVVVRGRYWPYLESVQPR